MIKSKNRVTGRLLRVLSLHWCLTVLEKIVLFGNHLEMVNTQLALPRRQLPLTLLSKHGMQWFGLPRWTFSLQIYVQHRLTAKEKLSKWGILCGLNCVLRDWHGLESHQHLFSEFQYSTLVREVVLIRDVIGRVLLNQDEVIWLMQHAYGNCCNYAVLRL